MRIYRQSDRTGLVEADLGGAGVEGTDEDEITPGQCVDREENGGALEKPVFSVHFSLPVIQETYCLSGNDG